MKKYLLGIVLAVFVASGVVAPVFAHQVEAKARVSTYKSVSKVKVNGYTKKSGKYVAPHYRTAPDKKKSNNWSTKGNINPYTGKKGTKKY
jgi:hypothetical protein